MTVVVGIPSIVTHPIHRIALHNVLRMLLHEALDTIPYRRDRLHILIQTNHKTILLLIIPHEFKRIVADVAVQLDTRFHAPIPLILVHQLLAEEESGLETAHVAVAFGVSVNDFPLRHVFTDFARFVLVNVWGVGPVLVGDLAVVGFPRDEGRGDFFEGCVKGLVV